MLTGWAKYQKYDIDYTNKIGASVTGRYVTIFIHPDNNETSKIFDEIGANKQKMAITLADGETQIYAHIVYWDTVGKIGIIHACKSDWTISADTYVYIYYDNTHADNTDYIGIVTGSAPATSVYKSDNVARWGMESTTLLKDHTANNNNGYAETKGAISFTSSWACAIAYLQGVAVDGTYVYVSAVGSAYPGGIWKYNYAGELQASNTSLANCTQIADLYYKDGYLYVADATIINDPDSLGGRVVRFNASDLSYDSVVLNEGIEGYFTEGVTFYDNCWWLCFGHHAKIRKYNSSWVFQKEYTLPSAPASQGFQGIEFYTQDDNVYCLLTIHDGETTDEQYVYIYLYDSSSDSFYYITKKAPGGGHSHDQGIFCETRVDGAVIWFADRTNALISKEDFGAIFNAMPVVAAGLVGNALTFDGSTNYIQANVRLIDAYPFTLGVWFKTTNTGATKYLLMICDKDSPSIYWGLLIASTNIAGMSARNTTQYVTYGAATLTDGNWHQIVGVFNDATNRDLYVDGIQDTTNENNTSVTYTTAVDRWGIGKAVDSTPDFYMNGLIDEPFVANTAWSAAEIKMEYNNCKDLLLTYGDEQTSGTTVEVSTLALTSSVLEPVVAIVQSVTIEPSALALTAAMKAPAINNDEMAAAVVLECTLTLKSPTIITGLSVSIEAGQLTCAVIDPVISIVQSATAEAEALSLALTLNDPIISIVENVTVEPTALSLTSSLIEPVVDIYVSGDVTVEPSAIEITSALNAPVVEVTAQGWVKPTAFSDPSSHWTDEANIYDGNLTTYASCVAGVGTNGYLVMSLQPIYCDKIRIHVNTGTSSTITEEIDVYYDDGWHNIYSGTLSENTWVEVNLSATKLVSQARIRKTTDNAYFLVNEFALYDLSLSAYVTPVSSNLDLSVKSPTYTISSTVEPEALSLSCSVQPVVVVTDAGHTAEALDLTLTAVEPGALPDTRIMVDAFGLTSVLNSIEISIIGNILLEPSAFQLSLAVKTPDIVIIIDITVEPAVIETFASLIDPVVSSTAVFLASEFFVDAVLHSVTVVIVQNVTVEAETFALALSLETSEIIIGQTIWPDAFEMVLAVNTLDFVIDATLAMEVLEISANIQDLTVIGDVSFSVTKLSLSTSLKTSQVTLCVDILASAFELELVLKDASFLIPVQKFLAETLGLGLVLGDSYIAGFIEDFQADVLAMSLGMPESRVVIDLIFKENAQPEPAGWSETAKPAKVWNETAKPAGVWSERR